MINLQYNFSFCWRKLQRRINFLLSHSKKHLHIGVLPDKMPDYYHSGDVMYFPTHYEGFSMSTLEALS